MALMSDGIINSWQKNAQKWVNVIDNQLIESRRYTNIAIEDIIMESTAAKILDVGCGEGWLTRGITKMGKQAVGIDAIDLLLDNARTKGPESFYCMSFEEIIAGKNIPEFPFDLAVFNFCIYQKDALLPLLKSTKHALSKKGIILIQTLHPYFLLDSNLAYRSQMISDSWKGLPGDFTEGHQWYARTFQDWMSVILQADMRLVDIKETVNADQKPISLILKIST